MGRTVNFAAKKLPEKARPAFLRAWKACGCMDLYDGNLDTYLRVIAQVLERRNEQKEEFKKLANDIQNRIKHIEMV